MPPFVAALLALIASFSHGGQPATTPPQFEDVTQFGSQVSEMAKNFHFLNSTNETDNETENQTNNSTNNSGSFVSNLTPDLPKLDGRAFGALISSNAQNQTQNQSQNQTNNETENETGNQSSNNSANPDTFRVNANNIRSGFQMPTFIPQVAVDNSGALEPPASSGSPFPLPPGHRR